MEKVNIEKGYYTFTITDSWGHGLKMVTLAHTGSDFKYEEKFPFFVFL
jgi:hypothetical protein